MTSPEPPPAEPTSPAPAAASSSARLDAIDWLRGLAVVLMIEWHLYDSWLAPAAKAMDAYWWLRFFGGFPARLFLFLVGVSMAIGFEKQIARNVDRASICRGAVKRGAQIVVLGYLFRFQEYTLSGWGSNWRDLFRVDILNCIGACMMLVPFIAAPRLKGGVMRPQILAALAAAAVFVALGPVIGPAVFPGWLPRPLTSYIGGQRPMALFPLFPWAAWPLVGVAVGHTWVRASREPRRQLRVFVLTGVVGAALAGAVTVVRRIDPHVIRYPSELVQQMGPGTFFFRLGLIGALALLAYGVTRLQGARFSVMRQFGRTSLLVYWIHVDLCYGMLSRRLQHRLGLGWATVGLVAMVALMLAISVMKTHTAKGWRKDARTRRPAIAG